MRILIRALDEHGNDNVESVTIDVGARPALADVALKIGNAITPAMLYGFWLGGDTCKIELTPLDSD